MVIIRLKRRIGGDVNKKGSGAVLELHMLEKLYVTGLVILRSLLIPGRSPYPADSAAVEGEGYVQVTPNAISFHPAVLERLVGKEGKLALFIPGCLALAAPFVLFRLKRQGYSGCRVTSTGEGLFVDASR